MQVLNRFKISTRLGIGFGFVIAFFVIFGFLAVYETGKIADSTAKIYEHPLTVSNSLREIRINTIKIHHNMKEVVLVENKSRLAYLKQVINLYDNDVFGLFSLIQEKFLGDPETIVSARQAFMDWQLIRSEVFDLIEQDKVEQAKLITQDKESAQIEVIDNKLIAIADFASGKAQEFLDRSAKLNQRLERWFYIIGSLFTFLGIFLAIVFVKSLSFRINLLKQDIDVISTGNLDHKVRVADCDEIGQLGSAFNDMVYKLKGMVASHKDLDEVNQKLSSQNEVIKNIISNIPHRIFWKNKESKYLGCNINFAKDAGLVQPDDVIGKTDYDLTWLREQADGYVEDDREVISNGILKVNYEEQITRADGSVMDVITSKVPLRDSDGNVTGVLGVYNDITESKEFARKLKDADKLLRLAMESAGEGFWEWDFLKDTISFDEIAAGMLGYSPEEMCNKSEWAVSQIHPDDREVILQKFYDYVEGRADKYFAEFRHRKKDGSYLWIRSNAKVVRREENDKPLLVVGTHQDITEQRQADLWLRENNERLKLAMQAANMGTWEWDIVNDSLILSEETFEIFKIKKEEFGADYQSYIDLAVEESQEEVDSIVQGFLENAGESSIIEYEHQIVCGDNTIAWIEVRGTLFVDEEGKPDHMTGICADITARKNAEQESQELKTQLHHTQKLEALGTLAGGIAHDFNNILAAMLGYANLNLKYADPNSKAKQNLEQILIAGSRAKSLVNQILAFSRKATQDRENILISSVVNEVSAMMRASIPATIDIEINVNAPSSLIKANSSQIHQIIVNLCTNSVHAIGNKPGKIRLGVEDINFDSTFTTKFGKLPAGSYVKLIVVDNGCGMDNEVLERIFEPFYSTKPIDKGSGMGLAMVHGIVNSYGGLVTVESQVGEGTTFEIYLPKVTGVIKIDKSESDALKIRGGHETIILIDDEPQIVDMMRQLLEHFGYEVIGLTDCHEAVEIFKKRCEDIDLIITDYAMPNMTGKELLEEFSKIRDGIPAIMCTGFSDIDNGDLDADKYIDEFITKPIDMNKISTKIRKVLRKGRSNK